MSYGRAVHEALAELDRKHAGPSEACPSVPFGADLWASKVETIVGHLGGVAEVWLGQAHPHRVDGDTLVIGVRGGVGYYERSWTKALTVATGRPVRFVVCGGES